MIRHHHPHIAQFIVARQPGAMRECQRSLGAAGLELNCQTVLQPNWKSQNRISQSSDGSRRRPGSWRRSSLKRWCGQDWTTPAGPCSGPSTGLLHLHLFTALPTLDAQPSRLLLCRRMHLPLPLSTRTCRCGRQLDMFGHHRAACALAGVLGRRGYPLECAAAQDAVDGRRLEVVADGLSLWHGAQPAVDTTLVSLLHSDGRARRRAADNDGAALEVARRRKERTYPELAGEGGRARLVVLAAEVGGRWRQPWPERVLSLLHEFCRAGSKPRGFVGGAQCLRALQHGLSVCLCSTADQCHAPGETSRLCTRSCGMHVLASLPVWFP